MAEARLIAPPPFGRAIEKTDNPFDWLTMLECADKLVLVDSLYTNLVEQLNLPNTKTPLLRSRVAYTPVFKNGWTLR